MGMSASGAPTTADQLSEQPDDGRRYEVIDGVLFVTPAPSRVHQRAQMQLAVQLFAFAESLGLEVLAAPTAVRANAATEVQPDLIVLPRSAVERTDVPFERMAHLVLAIEIVSASSARTDRGVKRRRYRDSGVREYWIVNVKRRRVELWVAGRLEPDVDDGALVWQPVPATRPLMIVLGEYFVALPTRNTKSALVTWQPIRRMSRCATRRRVLSRRLTNPRASVPRSCRQC